jgi:hypothetical protein
MPIHALTNIPGQPLAAFSLINLIVSSHLKLEDMLA